MKKTIITTCICSLLLALSLNSAAQQPPKARDLYLDFQKNAKKPAAQRPGRPGSRVKLELMRNDKFSFVTAHHPLFNDDRIAFRTAVNYEGYLTVVNVGTSGKLNLLYAGRVSPTSDMRIPEKGWIRVTGKSGDEVVNFIMSSEPIQELQQIGILTSRGEPAPTGSTANLTSTAEAQKKLMLLNGNAVKRGRDLVVEDDGDETYVLCASVQEMKAPTGFSVTLKHH